MDEHPNAKLVRTMMEDLNSGDMQGVADLMADDVVWHEIGRDEPVRGKEALAARFTGPSAPDYEIRGELHDVVANDEHTIALVNATAKRDGRTFNYRTAEIMHIRNGKITERWAFSDDTEAINEFFGGD